MEISKKDTTVSTSMVVCYKMNHDSSKHFSELSSTPSYRLTV